MASIEAYFKHADELAKDITESFFNSAPGKADFSSEFVRLLNTAIRYRGITDDVAERRAFSRLREGDEERGKAARLLFAKAYKIFHDRQAARFN